MKYMMLCPSLVWNSRGPACGHGGTIAELANDDFSSRAITKIPIPCPQCQKPMIAYAPAGEPTRQEIDEMFHFPDKEKA